MLFLLPLISALILGIPRSNAFLPICITIISVQLTVNSFLYHTLLWDRLSTNYDRFFAHKKKNTRSTIATLEVMLTFLGKATTHSGNRTLQFNYKV